MLGELRLGGLVWWGEAPEGTEISDEGAERSRTRCLVTPCDLPSRVPTARQAKWTSDKTSLSKDRILRKAPLIVWGLAPRSLPLRVLQLIIARAFLQGCI